MKSPFALRLDQNVDSTVKRLDQMLAQLEGYRPLLEQNVACAEFDIRATFDGLISALGQRQMQLLKQLNKIANEKTNVIDSQKQMIENVRSDIVACMSDRNRNIGRMQENLSRAESAVISSSSAPFVSFRTEKPIMTQTICNYGRIVSQYCGHFADPSQPSSCLPRALEEEDENEESVGCGYHNQSMVFNPFHMQSRVKPDLLQWLSEEHTIDHPNRSRINHKMTHHTASKTPVGKFAQESQNSTPAHVAKSLVGQVNSTSQISIPLHLRMCDPLILRHWLDTNAAFKGLENIREQNDRKFSQATSLGSSDVAGGTDCESFAVLTNSTSGTRINSLKDWMVCDPLELTEIRGLLEPSQSRPVVTAASESHSYLQTWLAPSSASQISNSQGSFDRYKMDSSTSQRSNTNSRLGSLLPSYLTQTSVNDVDRWLVRSSRTDASSLQAQSNAHTRALNAVPDGTNEISVPLETSTPSSFEHTSELVTEENKTRQYSCIYSQCRGGPGGPTCCGAQKRAEERSDHLNSMEDVVSASMAASAATDETSTQPNLVDIASKPTVNPIVVQLANIVSTPLNQWLDESSSVMNDTLSPADKRNNSHSRNCDLQTWLHRDCALDSRDITDPDGPEDSSGTVVNPTKLCPHPVTNDCPGCPFPDETLPGTVVSSTIASTMNDPGQLGLWRSKLPVDYA
ncbi:hypothetical protein FGIG_09112 [Fasciola gigantica]|uniref:Uncharacterized protein n=1 Tax=Fasciola gigantica TaxID=46835 RepID=A0A504Y305_FASGI|nr:hypothetical protein FGIG_09112 [Fasciola gigantica]